MSGRPPGVPTHRGAVLGRIIARVLLRTVWSVRVRGAEHVPRSGPLIFAPNHTGFIDAPLLMSASPRPVHVLAKKELFHGPLGLLLSGVGQIPLDRDDPSRTMIKAGMGVLSAGRVLVVFPEGTRGAGDFSELRTGLAWFALRSGAPVVPVVFNGTGARGRNLGSMPGLRSRLEVVFGPPVTLPAGGGGTRSALDAATEQLRAALVAHRQAAAEPRFEEHRGD